MEPASVILTKLSGKVSTRNAAGPAKRPPRNFAGGRVIRAWPVRHRPDI